MKGKKLEKEIKISKWKQITELNVTKLKKNLFLPSEIF